MRFHAAVVLTVLIACTKPTESAVATPTATSSSTPTVGLGSAAASSTFGPAVLHALACPPPPVHPHPPDVQRGCESCAAGEFCRTYELRGTKVGECMKSQCQGDADCGRGRLCSCGPPNVCFNATCRTPADCGGRDCVSLGEGSFCRTDRDGCKSSSDCAKDQECTYFGGDARWGCRVRPPPPPPG